MAIDVEVSLVPMHPFPNPVGQPSHGKNVARPIKDKRIALVQAFARQNFIFDRDEARVVGLKCVGLECVRVQHLFNNNPARGGSLKSCHPERSMDFTK